MSSLASIHLRQARAFLRAGDASRAVELLEMAKAVSRDDTAMLRDVLDVLASAYQQVGDGEKAARCLEQLDRLGGPVQTQPHVGGSTPDVFIPTVSSSRRRWRNPLLIFGASACLVLCCLTVIWLLWRHKPATITAALPPEPATVGTPPQSTPPPGAAPSPGSVPIAAAVANRAPVAAKPSTASIFSFPDMKDDQVRECVGLLVLMGRYEGTVHEVHLQMDIPLGSGTAFVVKRSGILLTNKHVTHAAKENNFPGSLQDLSLPTMTLREVHYVLCFGPNPDDRSDATLAFESDKYDVAVLRTDRRFKMALDFVSRRAKQGEDVYAWGYPAVLSEMFNDQVANEPRVKQAVEKLSRTHTIDLLTECFSPESFKPTLTRGVVSVAERNIDGQEYAQSDVKVSPGNSGGPLLDTTRRVIAIVTLAGTHDANGYNFALLADQLQDEIAPYMGGD